MAFFLPVCTLYMTATITFNPIQPNREQQVSFTVIHANGISGNVTWNFGDVSNDQTGGTQMNYTYYPGVTPQNYIVKATYYTNQQQQVTDQTTVTVYEKRIVTASPPNPTIGQTVNFAAGNFLDPQIEWDFGDNSPFVYGGANQSHVYNIAGNYTVTARDFNGTSNYGIAMNVNVTDPTTEPDQEETGPRAPFHISFVQLRFEDGKSYKAVGKNYSPLIAFADMKYEGTGFILAQWLVDGQIYKQISRVLPFAREITLNSEDIPDLPTQISKTDDLNWGNIPGLSTLIPGIHEVEFRIVQPQTDYDVPLLRYFVSSQPVKEEKYAISLSQVKNLDEIEIPTLVDSIEAPAFQHFIINGSILSKNRVTLPYVLLRIYLDDEMVDQQLIKNLKPKQEVAFKTSIYNPTLAPKKVFIALYNISERPANLLSIKKLVIITRK